MALRSRNKVEVSYSVAGMTDIIFLLLLFFMLTSTLVAPNALKLLLAAKQQSDQCQGNYYGIHYGDIRFFIEKAPY